MGKKLSYFAYISRAKVAQLYDQITEFSVEKRSIKKEKEGSGDVEAGSGALLGFIKGTVKVGGKYTVDLEEIGHETTVQKLGKVLAYIEQNEKVLDLGELCRKEEGKALDAFCYTYTGQFFALARLGRGKYARLHVTMDALNRSADEIVISKKLLLEPGIQENALQETGPNDGRLVSDVCLLCSEVNGYTISLACSLKYFSDMGGRWEESAKEWEVEPHSGNFHFFEGVSQAHFDSILFINGIRGKTIMGTPLFLSGSIDAAWKI